MQCSEIKLRASSTEIIFLIIKAQDKT